MLREAKYNDTYYVKITIGVKQTYGHFPSPIVNFLLISIPIFIIHSVQSPHVEMLTSLGLIISSISTLSIRSVNKANHKLQKSVIKHSWDHCKYIGVNTTDNIIPITAKKDTSTLLK